MNIIIKDMEHIAEAAKQFVNAIGNHRVFAFYGHMGAGKTTFIKAICEELGVDDVVTSPTFAIVNEYTAADGTPIYHFDFYRIKKLEEVYDMGYEDYFYGNGLCFIEWPEMMEELLPDGATQVPIADNSDGTRTGRVATTEYTRSALPHATEGTQEFHEFFSCRSNYFSP